MWISFSSSCWCYSFFPHQLHPCLLSWVVPANSLFCTKFVLSLMSCYCWNCFPFLDTHRQYNHCIEYIHVFVYQARCLKGQGEKSDLLPIDLSIISSDLGIFPNLFLDIWIQLKYLTVTGKYLFNRACRISEGDYKPSQPFLDRVLMVRFRHQHVSLIAIKASLRNLSGNPFCKSVCMLNSFFVKQLRLNCKCPF